MFPYITTLIGWSKYYVETPNVILKEVLIVSFIYSTSICLVPTICAETLGDHSKLNRLIVSHAVSGLSLRAKSFIYSVFYKCNDEFDVAIGVLRRGM